MSATLSAKMTPEEKEAFHREAEARVKTFTFEAPAKSQWDKDVVSLTKSPLIKVNMHVVHDGGENNLHYHTNSDTTWMVLTGRCNFYGPGDVLIADLGPNQGLLMPGGARYRFAKTSPDTLQILQMVGIDRASSGGAERINVTANPNEARLLRNTV